MELHPIRKFILITVVIGVGLSFGLYKYVDRKSQHAIISQDIRDASPLPDLAPLAMYDIHLSQLNGRTVLRFTSTFLNRGRKEFELVGDATTTTADGLTPVYQRIVNDDGTEQRLLVGDFLWHALHNHYHYSDFAKYIFSMVKPADGTSPGVIPSITQKTTFCLRDNYPVDLSLPGASVTKVFSTCGLARQGVSIGWTDVYKYDLPDQYIDVQDMPAGVYALSFLLDPNQRFSEQRQDNNLSTVLIDLNIPKYTARVIASAAPFPTFQNVFLDNILIKAEGKEPIYVLHNNKKRWIRTEEIFNSYGFQWNSVYTLAQSMVEVIPYNNLIRVTGTDEIYALNDAGYKRHVPNPEVFFSYGFTEADVAAINQPELDIYPNSYLIMTPGDENVYQISTHTRKKLGTLDFVKLSGYDLASIHIINETDFNSYIDY